MRDIALSAALLDWYDIHARVLPWRRPPGDTVMADPYRIWLSEIMLQQTTVAAVIPYFEAFTTRWPTVGDLASAADEEVMAAWAGLGYYARARNLLKCARAVATDRGGRFPETEDDLRSLPGIGPYTAAAIAAIAFDRRATVVDGNVERVMARLHAVTDPLPSAKPELRRLAAIQTPDHRPGDYAQAVMDLGATICTPRNPACGICPLRPSCRARISGIAAELPRKSPKREKPIRYGFAYVVRRADGAILMETRPERGLLGGMKGLPGSEWSEGAATPTPPVGADWHFKTAEVRHTFTHFHLILAVHAAEVPAGTVPERGTFIAASDFAGSDLPTVFRKVLRQGLSILEGSGS